MGVGGMVWRWVIAGQFWQTELGFRIDPRK
jgi:hypothetical protein